MGGNEVGNLGTGSCSLGEGKATWGECQPSAPVSGTHLNSDKILLSLSLFSSLNAD